ncbi:MerR family transcriptional regulator [Kitasatospora sp. NBC_01287]|uniref:MerR family transcriptional regulator n=1 Tax=Kitasatospora sp. NBC_01287 TaxID=2903573 RepID=UPI002251D1CE|nr:MerR family transcriptional regulator [Kitasatospora sp. NBC_01287]MCX4744250.1 MerR family transcriptional regulator [Kitasatospora sp. NBC_01287]
MTAVPDPPSASSGAALSTGGVARQLGVSPTTVRSWERRYGIGPAEHEAGRHRRWSPRDIAVLEAMCRLTARGVPPAEAARLAREGAEGAEPGVSVSADAGAEAGAGRVRAAGSRRALPLGTVRPECRGLARAAVRLDAPAVERLLGEVVADLGVTVAWNEVMTPALRAVGRKWAAEGERYVEVEHLLSWHISGALRQVTRCAEAGGGPAPVLLAGMPDELHALALEAVAAGLAERGLPFRMFGPALPAPALIEAVRRTGPAAVLLWSQLRPTADRQLARRAAATAWGVRGARSRPLVLLTGPGWGGGRHPEGTLRPRGLTEALELCARLAAS